MLAYQTIKKLSDSREDASVSHRTLFGLYDAALGWESVRRRFRTAIRHLLVVMTRFLIQNLGVHHFQYKKNSGMKTQYRFAIDLSFGPYDSILLIERTWMYQNITINNCTNPIRYQHPTGLSTIKVILSGIYIRYYII